MPEIWIPTTPDVYRAIYGAHREDLRVFRTHTCGDGGCEFHAEGHVLTEWGFRGSDYAIIRSIARGDRDEGRRLQGGGGPAAPWYVHHSMPLRRNVSAALALARAAETEGGDSDGE